jgi:DNA-directed RNA polymerase omega subunit
MSELEIRDGNAQEAGESSAPRNAAPSIESRFLFVDVAAMRAKQLRRGAKPRLPQDGHRPTKAERVAMEEVKTGLVEWQLPDFKAVFDTR